jgi:hypothetical protein
MATSLLTAMIKGIYYIKVFFPAHSQSKYYVIIYVPTICMTINNTDDILINRERYTMSNKMYYQID